MSWFLHRLRTVEHLAELESSHTAMASTWDRSGGNVDGTDFKQLEAATPDSPARNVLLDVAGPGCIHRIFLGRVVPKMATTHIQVFLDQSDRPVIDMPIPVFFDDQNGPFHYPLAFHRSYPGMVFPMPFAHGAVVALQNTGSDRVEKVQVRLDLEILDGIPDDWGRFHGTWRETRAATDETPRFGPKQIPGQVVLERECRGKYVGAMLSIDWPHEHWWGEGDWLIWTDQSGWPPDYHGTGSEEYFNSGWGQFDRKAISGFTTLRPGFPTVYSFHFNDAFQFQQRIRVVEEQLGLAEGDRLIHETHPIWRSTAYWYALPAQTARSTDGRTVTE